MNAANTTNPPLVTPEQKESFRQNGFLKLPGIVPPELVDRAKRAINADLGQNGMHPDKLPEYRSQTYCRDLTTKPPITDLYNASPLKAVAEAFIGEGKIKPVGSGQIALRFPAADMEAAPRPPGPHLDGMYSPNNGVKEGTIGNFTALLGVFLSDLPRDYMGNFTVWPGTHTLYETYFREHGPQSLLNGMPPVELPAPQQFLGQAGDAALVHYQLAHGIVTKVALGMSATFVFIPQYRFKNRTQWTSARSTFLLNSVITSRRSSPYHWIAGCFFPSLSRFPAARAISCHGPLRLHRASNPC